MKYCKDCRHFKEHVSGDIAELCWHPDLMTDDPLYGSLATKARQNREHGKCGMDARLFDAVVAGIFTKDDLEVFESWNIAPRKRGRPKKHV